MPVVILSEAEQQGDIVIILIRFASRPIAGPATTGSQYSRRARGPFKTGVPFFLPGDRVRLKKIKFASSAAGQGQAGCGVKYYMLAGGSCRRSGAFGPGGRRAPFPDLFPHTAGPAGQRGAARASYLP